MIIWILFIVSTCSQLDGKKHDQDCYSLRKCSCSYWVLFILFGAALWAKEWNISIKMNISGGMISISNALFSIKITDYLRWYSVQSIAWTDEGLWIQANMVESYPTSHKNLAWHLPAQLKLSDGWMNRVLRRSTSIETSSLIRSWLFVECVSCKNAIRNVRNE